MMGRGSKSYPNSWGEILIKDSGNLIFRILNTKLRMTTVFSMST